MGRSDQVQQQPGFKQIAPGERLTGPRSGALETSRNVLMSRPKRHDKLPIMTGATPGPGQARARLAHYLGQFSNEPNSHMPKLPPAKDATSF